MAAKIMFYIDMQKDLNMVLKNLHEEAQETIGAIKCETPVDAIGIAMMVSVMLDGATSDNFNPADFEEGDVTALIMSSAREQLINWNAGEELKAVAMDKGKLPPEDEEQSEDEEPQMSSDLADMLEQALGDMVDDIQDYFNDEDND